MEVKEITELWLNLPFLKKFQTEGERICNDIKALKRLERIREELKERKGKK